MSVLVIAEHHQGRIADNPGPAGHGGAGRLGAGAPLAAGAGADGGRQAAALTRVNQVLLAEHPMLAEGSTTGSTDCSPGGQGLPALPDGGQQPGQDLLPQWQPGSRWR